MQIQRNILLLTVVQVLAMLCDKVLEKKKGPNKGKSVKSEYVAMCQLCAPTVLEGNINFLEDFLLGLVLKWHKRGRGM